MPFRVQHGRALTIDSHHCAPHRPLYLGGPLEPQGLLVRDAEQSYLTLDEPEEDPMNQLQGHSITYRIAVGPQQGRKVFTLQTLPGTEEPFIDAAQAVAGFSLHASVAVKVNERKKLERICGRPPRRYISRPAVSEKRLSLTRQGKVRYQLKTPYRAIEDKAVIEKILTHLDSKVLCTQPKPLPQVRAPPAAGLFT